MGDEEYVDDMNVDYPNEDYMDYGGDYDLGDDGFGELTRSTELKRSKSFDTLSEAELEDNTKSMINEVVEFCGLPSSTAATVLLRHYNWNKEKLISDYTTSDPDKILKEAGISNFDLEKKLSPSENSKQFDCLICLERWKGSETFALSCGHRYCVDCWKAYLEHKIEFEADPVATHCPCKTCREPVHEHAFKRLVSPTTFTKYQKAAARSLVKDNPNIKHCPAPGCLNAIKVERRNRREPVTCACNFRFCFQCSDYEIGDHVPATCENVEAWTKKASDESENVRWMMANTKKCPKCRSNIEKNGGCMHMTCRKDAGGCGFEFCWLCRGDWKEHGSQTGGYYSCNKYDASAAKTDDTKAAELKTELETYMFYYHRYEAHHNAWKIADQQRRNSEKKATTLMEKLGVRAQDTIFLREATEALIECRRIMKNSYIYGYYLDKSKTAEKSLFEYLQEDLEKHTNHLSELYEISEVKDYSEFVAWKEKMANYTRVTQGFLRKFVDGVIGGLTDSDLVM